MSIVHVKDHSSPSVGTARDSDYDLLIDDPHDDWDLDRFDGFDSSALNDHPSAFENTVSGHQHWVEKWNSARHLDGKGTKDTEKARDIYFHEILCALREDCRNYDQGLLVWFPPTATKRSGSGAMFMR